MKALIASIIFLTIGSFFTSCNIAGPAYPEKNGRAYLEKQGYPEELISRLIEGKALEPHEVLDFQSSKSTDVRFLVARNPHLTHEQIANSISDKDDFARSGAATNTKLSASQIAFLTNDPSHTVYSKLAGNPALSDEQILRLRDSRELNNLWFAMNPNCPASIRESILASDDSQAKHWLKIIDGWKKDGYYIQDDNGRWSKP